MFRQYLSVTERGTHSGGRPGGILIQASKWAPWAVDGARRRLGASASRPREPCSLLYKTSPKPPRLSLSSPDTMRPPITLLQVLSASIIFSSASALNSQDLRQPSSLRTPEAPNHASPATANEYRTEYYFHQLIDHENPSLGTFKQRYFFSDQHYRGPGSPIVIGTPGEKSADGYHADLTEGSIMSAMLENWGAAGVVLERRFSFAQFRNFGG